MQAIAIFAAPYLKVIPKGWIGVGEWHLGQRRVSVLYSTVAFYAPDERTAAILDRRLHDFAPRLPHGVRYVDRNALITRFLNQSG